MFGIAFIIIGIVLLLQAAGVFGSLSASLVWGVAFLVIGVVMAMRHSVRRQQRMEWMAKHRERRMGASVTPQAHETHDSETSSDGQK